jgi:sulfate permease, SulP family
MLISVVGYVESVAVGKVYARRNRYEIDPNQELVSLGAANLAAGLFQGQPVTGGFSRTAVNADAGARTPLASLVTAMFIGGVLLFFTGVFTQLPQAILGAIVIAAVVGLIDVVEARHIAAIKRSDGLSLGVAFLATLLVGVEAGIAIAVGFSVVLLVARLMNPHSAELGRIPGTNLYRNLDRFSDAQPLEGVGILRIDASLNFANAAYLKRRLRSLVSDNHGALAHIVLDAGGINDLDTTGEASLAELIEEFDDDGITIHLVNLKGPVRDVLIRSGLWQRLTTRIHPSIESALQALDGRTGTGEQAKGLDERDHGKLDDEPKLADP